MLRTPAKFEHNGARKWETGGSAVRAAGVRR